MESALTIVLITPGAAAPEPLIYHLPPKAVGAKPRWGPKPWRGFGWGTRRWGLGGEAPRKFATPSGPTARSAAAQQPSAALAAAAAPKARLACRCGAACRRQGAGLSIDQNQATGAIRG